MKHGQEPECPRGIVVGWEQNIRAEGGRVIILIHNNVDRGQRVANREKRRVRAGEGREEADVMSPVDQVRVYGAVSHS